MKRNLYRKRHIEKKFFSSSLWLSSSEGPYILSGDGESGTFQDLQAQKELYAYDLLRSHERRTKIITQLRMRTHPWPEYDSEGEALGWESGRSGSGAVLIQFGHMTLGLTTTRV